MVGGCLLSDLADHYGTPLYVIDEQTIRTSCKAYRQALRDMPTALSAVDPNIAAYMFPTQPANSTKRATAAIESSE